MKHSSKPYNLKLANVFFKSGIMVLCKACDRYLELLRVDDHEFSFRINKELKELNCEITSKKVK